LAHVVAAGNTVLRLAGVVAFTRLPPCGERRLAAGLSVEVQPLGVAAPFLKKSVFKNKPQRPILLKMS